MVERFCYWRCLIGRMTVLFSRVNAIGCCAMLFESLSDYLHGSLSYSLGFIFLGLVTHKVVSCFLPMKNEVVESQYAEDGLFSDMIIPSRCLRWSRSRYFRGKVTSISNPPKSKKWRPILVFANKASGSNQGSVILEQCRKYLNPIQVHDLNKRGPMSTLSLCRLLPDTRFFILVCGGDGTVNWILSQLDQLRLKLQPQLAVLPLGTGNDLSISLGWGASFDEFDSVENYLTEIRFGTPVTIDRWKVTIVPTRTRLLSLSNQSKVISMTNYFSVGCDALIALNFHKQRQRKPRLFSARSLNKLLYFSYGALDVLENHCQNLHTNIEVWLDGNKLDLPPLECLLFLNISSWGGGCQIWNNSLNIDGSWKLSDPGDGAIEVLGAASSFHLAQIQVNLSEPYRLGQAHEVIIIVKNRIPVQSDGEPWEQDPCHIDMSSLVKVTFLAKASKIGYESDDIVQLETN